MSVNRKILAEYYFKIYEIDPYFYKNCQEKIQVDKNGHEDIPFRINVYFSEYKLMKKDILRETLFLKRKDKKHYKTKLIVNLLELILIKEIKMHFPKLVEYKHLLVSFKNKKIKRITSRNKTIKRTHLEIWSITLANQPKNIK